MRTLLIALFAAFALTACDQQKSASPSPPQEQDAGSQAAPEPAPEAQPSTTDQPANEAPGTAGEEPAPPPPPPPPPPPLPPPVVAPEPPPAPEPEAAPVQPAPKRKSQPSIAEPSPSPTRGAKAPPRATPVIVEIGRTNERRAANGGSAVVLFTNAANVRTRNLQTCQAVWSLMDTASVAEVRVGVRKSSSGVTEALRPLYWMNSAPTPAGARPDCADRLARYDYTRAATIRKKYGLTDAGPYFLVARADETAAARIDLTGRTNAEVAQLVRYFRDGFAFEADIFDPSRAQPERNRRDLIAFFGQSVQQTVVAAVGFVSAPRTNCRLGDLLDGAC